MPVIVESTYQLAHAASLARGEAIYEQYSVENPQAVWIFDQQTQPVQLGGDETKWSTVAVASADPWFLNTWDKISRHVGLKDGWDGSDAPAPSRDALDHAYALAVLLAAKPDGRRPVFAVDSEGRPGFATNNRDLYLHLTIDKPGLLSWLAVIEGVEHFGDDVRFDGVTLPPELDRVL
jgi:hypothetical protein